MTDVRPGNAADLPALTDVYNHYVRETAATFDTVEQTVSQRQEWFAHYAPHGPHRLLVATEGGALLGYATSSRFRGKPAYDTSVETSIYLTPGATGRGVGRLLYCALLDALGTAGLHRAYAGIALPNDASVALHERLGFRVLGTYHEVGHKHGRWWDVRWYEYAVPGPT